MDPAAAWRLLGSKVRLPCLLETFTTCTMTCPEGVAVPADAGEDAAMAIGELPSLLLSPPLDPLP